MLGSVISGLVLDCDGIIVICTVTIFHISLGFNDYLMALNLVCLRFWDDILSLGLPSVHDVPPYRLTFSTYEVLQVMHGANRLQEPSALTSRRSFHS